jgi:eukaryotic-like serine/threonine-protein kinase
MPVAKGPDLDALRLALVPRYLVERQLGRGGMGVVYLATDVRLDRQVAIKVLPPDRSRITAARARFLREARTAARLSHPNIVPIHSVEEHDDLVYYVMTHVDGETLDQRVRRLGPLAPMDVARLLRDVAWALGYAHAHGVIHRDIKPDNILFDAATGRALVTDFGIARVATTTVGTTAPQEVFGTAEFMSPEQATGGPVDGRSDTYSLGVVAFFAASGRLPFEDRDPRRLIAQHVARPAPPIIGLVPAIPGRLAGAVERCLAKRPDDRFQRAEELADLMTRLLQEYAAPPLPVRAFVTDSKLLTAPARLYAGFVALVVLPLVVRVELAARLPLLRAALVGAALAAVVAPVVLLLWRVRSFLASGHTRQDLLDLLATEWVRQREELAFAYGGRPTWLERALRGLAYTALGATGLAVAFGLYAPARVPDPDPMIVAGAAAAVALLAAVVARLRTIHRTDPGAGRRYAFWRGRLGRWLFRLAGLRFRRPRAGVAPLRSFVPPSLTPPAASHI